MDILINLLVVIFGFALILVGWWMSRRNPAWKDFAHNALLVFGALNILVLVFLVLNHINFPLFLDLMEGVVWQHFQRAAAFQPIYPEPTPEYVPLAYNPLFYVLAVPFSWIFGVNLFTLRLVAILGFIGSAAVMYFAVRKQTGSTRWSWLTVGVFAAAYGVMDAYLDTAHSDSWLLFTALLGTFLISLNQGWKMDLAAVIVLVISFWFKQHGAVFAVGGVVYLTLRYGLLKSLPFWVLAGVLGPGLYLLAGPAIFGSHFLVFTWEVPRNWSDFGLHTLRRYIAFIVKSYPLLAASAGIYLLVSLLPLNWRSAGAVWQQVKKLNIWLVQFIFAALTGLMGSLDIGSSNNVYIPMGAFFILVGMLGLKDLEGKFNWMPKYYLAPAALVITFGLFAYNPLVLVTPANADESYADLISFLNDLDAQVYAPTLAQLPQDYIFYPAGHWVALEDMIRGPGKDTSNHPNTRRLLEPAMNPSGPAYILANYPLEVYYWIEFLNEYYVLEEDLGARFEPLRLLPKRWDHGWPRYLYRYDPSQAQK
jgi:hypothetical protein